ncbi:ring-cleaving dioxygenase [Natronomonas sp. CBA1123]|uniref:ring-cleaving dioxygenase n=1 Tax=Natronomonas sp. CBA1123 TaxID=2668070 RepID=UPI0012EA736A|nr:ring-cleaving dioxygenase [Natronomonas sp. CBA1123]MUV86563.1 ring-cleaving dioxygenase [Natronomonas sp. CBA1123]
MPEAISGLHHVTAIASDPEENVDFYTDVLGLRLVKKTVNFDDVTTYHLYYGDGVGSPGTILTFFPFGAGQRGSVGRGQTSATAFVVPEGSLDYWQERFDDHGVEYDAVEERFDEHVLPFYDHDGQPLELVTGATDIEPWDGSDVPVEHAIRGFHGVTLLSADAEATVDVLETMGYERLEETGHRTRFAGAGDRAAFVDVLDDPEASTGMQGAGTVHHVAFRVSDDDAQMAWREELAETGLRVTPQKDRRYFRSIYFREPGGVLFEFATDGPGFDADEPLAELGSELKLPPWLEADRESIERSLPPLAAD